MAAPVFETQDNIDNMEIFLNIESEGASIGTSNDLSLEHVFNPDALDHHIDNA